MLYAFAILALPATVKLPPLQGLGDAPVDFITEGDITAVVDRTVVVTDLEKLSEADLLAVVLRHDQVISELFTLLFGSEPATANHSSLLPLRLGTAFGSEAALRQVLRDASAPDLAANLASNLAPSQLLKNQLWAVMGCGELLLKITVTPPAVNPDETAPNLKGRAYLLAKKAQYEQTQQWQKQIETESAQLVSQLEQIAHAAPLVLNPHPPENLRWCVLLQWDRLLPLQNLLGQWQADHPHWQITLGSFGAAYHSIARLAEAATTGNIH
ncbi:MAG: GvpL/GvpF family gas vesicle protein [Pseudanabaena sp. ELA607]|jgi:hypothetical protein